MERLHFFARNRRQVLPWQVILLVDQSGSMVGSVIHSAVTAACLWGLPGIRTHLVAFDTSIVDLTADVLDPVELLMKVQLGGGTDIGQAVGYAAELIEAPARAIVVLISDFYEGASPALLPQRVRALVGRRTLVLGLAALDPNAAPAYDREMAGHLVEAGAEVGAMTPGELAGWLATKIRGRPMPQPPARPDLLALTPDGLTQLSNAGLVKRAQREAEAGAGPELADDDAGAVVARFADGTVTRLAPGKPPTTPPAPAPRRACAGTAWPWFSPTNARARRRRETCPARPANRHGIPAPSMPTPSRRRCRRARRRNCGGCSPAGPRYGSSAGTNCAHVALALRAFRAAEPGSDEVTLGGEAAPVAADDLAEAAGAVLRRFLDAGVVAGPSAHAAVLERARRAVEALGAVQALLVLADLGEQVGAYEKRSACYDERTVLALAAELFARCRAAERSAWANPWRPPWARHGSCRLARGSGPRVVAFPCASASPTPTQA